MLPDRIETPRLSLNVMTVAAIDALVAGDRVALEREVGATFPDPLTPPPETGDVLGFFRQLIAGGAPFLPRFIVRRDGAAVVGSGGVMAPDADGRSLCGYGIYPEHEGNGYATEALSGLVAHVRAEPEIATVVATIHPHNEASRRVAAKAGLRRMREIDSEVEGRLEVWELSLR